MKGNAKFQLQVTENKDVNYFPPKLEDSSPQISFMESFVERRSLWSLIKDSFLDPRIQSVQFLISKILELCPIFIVFKVSQLIWVVFSLFLANNASVF